MFFSSTLENEELDLFLSLTFQKKELALLVTDCRIFLTDMDQLGQKVRDTKAYRT